MGIAKPKKKKNPTMDMPFVSKGKEKGNLKEERKHPG
jgi:hypothetical protein